MSEGELATKFDALAETFTRLEASGRSLDAVRAVAELLARAAADERAPIVYLLQGRLRPAYEGVELGVGERLLERVVAAAYNAAAGTVARLYKQAGDLGLVAESLAGEAKSRNALLTVKQAYAALLEVSETSGTGSVEQKVRLLTTLLRRAGPRGARYLVRIAQGRLRLGVGDATILEATAAAALGGRGKRAIIEQAYNVRSDLGGVVALAFARGGRGLARIGPRVGIPVRPALAQRLPSAAAILARLGTVHAEPKYDGFRLQVHRDGERVWIFSRRLENVTEMFPEIAVAARRQLRARRAIIEGEAIGYEPRTGRFLPFQVTMTRKRKYGVAEHAARHPLRLFAFDLLLEGSRDYLPRPQRERHRALSRLVRGGPKDAIAVTDALTTDNARQLEAYFDAMLRRNLEGIVAKRPDAPYRAGARGFDWVKLKRAYQSRLRDTVDLVLVGYLRGRGKRAALGIGSLLAAVYDPDHDRFRTVAKIGSGLTEEGWKSLRAKLDRLAAPAPPRRVESLITPDVWAEPRVVVEVLADEITRSPRHTCGKRGKEPGYALRFPRVLDGARTDKAAADATTEREIVEMYRMQGARGGPLELRTC